MHVAQLPIAPPEDASTWDQALYAFLVEKGNRSGSRRTVDSYSRILWPFFAERTPDVIRPADVLLFAHGIGLSGRAPSSATIGARIACLSSFYRVLIRMDILRGNPCDAVERPRSHQAMARGLSAAEVRRLLAVVPDPTVSAADGSTAFFASPSAVGLDGPARGSAPASLYIAAPGVTSVSPVLSGVIGPRALKFAPDGASLAFGGEIDGVPGTWVLDVTSGVPSKVIDDTLQWLSWSPDGQSLAGVVAQVGVTDQGRIVILPVAASKGQPYSLGSPPPRSRTRHIYR